MAHQLDAERIEARVYRAYWQDGLLDLLAGLTVLLIGAGWVMGFVLASVVVPPVALVLWPLLRMRVTEPRLGHVRFNHQRMLNLRAGVASLLATGVILGGLVILKATQQGPPSAFERWLAPAIPALVLALLSLCCAGALQLIRLAAYAFVFAVSGLFIATLQAEPGWAMIVGGGTVGLAGVVMLGRFLRAFPPLHDQLSG
jgi:hypothetical protein